MKKSTAKPAIPPVPSGLSPDAIRWWRDLHREFDLSDPAALLLLETAMRAHDRMQDAGALVAKHGVAVEDRYGQLKSNPATSVERDARAQMLAALKALNLDVLPTRPVGRPPGA